MKNFKNISLSFAAPLLVALAIIGCFQRKGNERVHSMPAFVIGSSFIITSFIRHQLRRKKLLHDLKEVKENDHL